MTVTLKRLSTQAVLAAAMAIAFAPASFAQSAATPAPDSSTADVAEQALNAQMGDAAKDLDVKVKDGIANISGWAESSAQVDKARTIVSKIPGVTKSYSSQVNTWSSDGGS